jgi:Double zinc ribbon/GAF domain
MKCPRCQQDNPSDAKFCLECGASVDEAPPQLRSSAELKAEIESLRRSLVEALEQQTATAEVLRIISTSPTDLRPVLEVVVKSAARFCGADDAIILRLDGENLWAAAHNGPIPVDFGLPVPCVRGTVGGRSVLERRAVHVVDLQAQAEDFPEGSAFAKRFGARTTLGVPLLREGIAARNDSTPAWPSRSVHGQTDRPAQNVRRPGRHRDRERPPVQPAGDTQSRLDRGPRAADCDQRDSAGDLELAHGCAARL